jgi:hypothetical protein
VKCDGGGGGGVVVVREVGCCVVVVSEAGSMLCGSGVAVCVDGGDDVVGGVVVWFVSEVVPSALALSYHSDMSIRARNPRTSAHRAPTNAAHGNSRRYSACMLVDGRIQLISLRRPRCSNTKHTNTTHAPTFVLVAMSKRVCL